MEIVILLIALLDIVLIALDYIRGKHIIEKKPSEANIPDVSYRMRLYCYCISLLIVGAVGSVLLHFVGLSDVGRVVVFVFLAWISRLVLYSGNIVMLVGASAAKLGIMPLMLKDIRKSK